jgi:hypothetical protein
LWHGSSIDTRKDLNISTCGLLEGVCAGVDEGAFCNVDEVELIPADMGGSRSRSLRSGVGAERMGREDSGAGVLLRMSRVFLCSDTAAESEFQALVFGQLGVLS